MNMHMMFGTETTHQYPISADYKGGSSRIVKQIRTVENMNENNFNTKDQCKNTVARSSIMR
jgi:hypothetical protein